MVESRPSCVTIESHGALVLASGSRKLRHCLRSLSSLCSHIQRLSVPATVSLVLAAARLDCGPSKGWIGSVTPGLVVVPHVVSEV